LHRRDGRHRYFMRLISQRRVPGREPGRAAPSEADRDRRAYYRACAIGALLATVLFVGALAMNGVGFHGNEYTTNFHTEQLRSLLHLHWDMPSSVLGIEGFARGGKWYMYYGPFPELFRLPFIVLFPTVADRITQWSMLLAFVVALVAVSRLLWRIRGWVASGRLTDRRERRAAGALVFLVGAGSSLLFLGSNAWIYHETEIWGVALALSAFEAILGAVEMPTAKRLTIAGAWTTATILTRGSVGTGPAVALGLVGVAALLPRARPWLGLPTQVNRRAAVGFVVAALIPIALYSAVNYERFGNPVVFPTAKQKMSNVNPQRKNFLAQSGGTYFGLKFAPTTLLQYLRPDALRFQPIAPFIDFPTRGRVVGGVTFDAFEPTSSIPSSMPALTVLAVIGLGATFGSRRRRLAPIRAPLFGSAIGAAAVIPFGYIANRYLADFVPFLVLAGVVGFQCLFTPKVVDEPTGSDVTPSRTRRRPRRLVLVVIAGLGVFSVLANISLAVSYHYTGPWAPEHVSAPFLADAIRLHETFPGGTPTVHHTNSLPFPPPARGSLYVVGDCDAVYWSAGRIPSLAWSPWHGVQRDSTAGRYDFTVAFPAVAPPPGTTEPLVIRGTPGRFQAMSVIYLPGNYIRFAFASEGHAGLPHGQQNARGFVTDKVRRYEPGARVHMVVVMDPNNGQVRVELGNKTVYRFFQVELTPRQNSEYIFPTKTVAFGRNDDGLPMRPAFSGTLVRTRTPRPSLCKTLGVK
ncbi:MAG: hypothetical protein ABJC79_06490, partial [Acidimicrobiia bacterium]